MKKTIIGTLVLLFSAQSFCQSESPYELKKKNDVITLCGGAVLFGSSFAVPHEVTTLSIPELAALNRQDVFFPDRNATYQYSERANKISDIGLLGPLLGGLAFSSLLPAVGKKKEWMNETRKLTLMWVEMNLINIGFSEAVKVTFRRTRPLAYNQNVPLSLRQDPEIRKSFFSAHTSISSSNMFFMAKVFSDYYPDSKWKSLVWGAALAVPAWTGYLRYRAGRHFPTDILTGYLVGAVAGILVPHFHKKKGQDSVLKLSISSYQDLHSSGGVLRLTF